MDVDELRWLHEAATQGPWTFDGPPHNHIIWSDSENRVCFMAHSDGQNPERDTATPALIVLLRNSVPDIIALHDENVRKARENVKLREALEWIAQTCMEELPLEYTDGMRKVFQRNIMDAASKALGDPQ